MDEGTQSGLLRWPSQDGIDHSESIAIIARDESYGELRADLERAVYESVSAVVGPNVLPSYSAHYYPVGPQAQGPSYYIVTLIDHIESLAPALSFLADAHTVALIVRGVFARLRARDTGGGGRSIVLPPSVLAKLCEDHVRENYHPRAKLSTEWAVTSTEFYEGISSPAHPMGWEEYLVTVRAGRKVYRYAIDGHAQVKTYYVMEGKRTTYLQVPALLA